MQLRDNGRRARAAVQLRRHSEGRVAAAAWLECLMEVATAHGGVLPAAGYPIASHESRSWAVGGAPFWSRGFVVPSRPSKGVREWVGQQRLLCPQHIWPGWAAATAGMPLVSRADRHGHPRAGEERQGSRLPHSSHELRCISTFSLFKPAAVRTIVFCYSRIITLFYWGRDGQHNQGLC